MHNKTIISIDVSNRVIRVLFSDDTSLVLWVEDSELAVERARDLGYIDESIPVLGDKEAVRRLALWRELTDRIHLHVQLAQAEGRPRSHALWHQANPAARCGSLTRKAIAREERLVEFCQRLLIKGLEADA